MAIANTTIQLKKSGATGNVPASLNLGELALNYADGKLYYKNASGVITYISSGPATNSFATVNANSSLVIATSNTDILSLAGANGVSITANTTSKTITIGHSGNQSFTGFVSVNSVGGVGNQNTAIQIYGANTKGGTGYLDFLGANNQSAGATNYNKWFRLSSIGEFQIINSAYTSNLFNLDDSGNVTIPGNILGGTSSSNYIQFGDGSKQYTANASLSNNQILSGLKTVSSTANITFDWVAAANNGQGYNFKVGDDVWLGDVNVADTMAVRGQQNAANGYIVFGNADTSSKLGRSGSGPLTYAGGFNATYIQFGDGTIQYTANAGGAGSTDSVARNIAQAAYNQANVTIGVDATQNTNITTANNAAWAAYAAGNTNATNITAVNTFAQSAYNTANNAVANIGPVITVNSAGRLYVPNTEAAVSNVTGALQVVGGISTKGNIYSTGGTLTINNGLATTGNSGTIVLGDGTFTKTYGGSWTFAGGVSSTGSGYTAPNSPGVTYTGYTFSGTGQALYQPLVGVVGITANSVNAFMVSAPASSVNYLQISANTTGNTPLLYAQGSDANVSINIASKGTASVLINGVDVVSALSSNVSLGAGIDATQNTNITTANNAAWAAYAAGNTNASNITIIQGVDNTQNTNITTANNAAWAAYAAGNTNATNITAVNNFAAAAFANANAAFATANSAQSNTVIIQGVDTAQNTRMTIIEGVDTGQNTRMTIIEGVNTGQNTRMTIIEGVDVGQNTRMSIIEGVDVGQNTFMQAAFNKANTSIQTTGDQSITGNLAISKDLSVTGNLVVLGNTFTVNTSSFTVVDSMITLGIGNYTTDVLDIGFAGHYNDGTNAHAGLIRDAGTKEWYLFKGYTPELNANNNVDILDASFRKANVNFDYGKGNLIATTATVNGWDVSSVWTTQNTNITAVNTFAASAYAQANTDYTTLTTTAGTYGNTSYVPVVTIAANGRVTSMSTVAITGGGSSSNAYGTISVTGSASANLVANTSNTRLNFKAESGVSIVPYAANNTVSIGILGGIQGVTMDWGLITDTITAVTFDFGPTLT